MVDQSRVKSGFDMEILLGKGFFGEVLLAFRDAEIIPHTVDIAPGLKLEIKGLDELIFTTDLKVGMRFNLILHAGDKTYFTGDTEIFFHFELITNRDSGNNVSDVIIRVSFDSVNNSSMDILLLAIGSMPVTINGNTYTLSELKDLLIDKLRDILKFEYRTNLVTNRVQDVQCHMLENPSALGVYINFLMRKGPEPGNLYPNRGNVNNAENLLEESTNIGVFAPSAVYPMLTTEIKATMAKETSPGNYEYPLFSCKAGPAKASGELKAFALTSAECLAAIPGFGIKDPEQLLMSINTRVHYGDIDADADAWMTFRPKIVSGRLTWDIPHLHTNIDVDWDDQLKIALIGGFFLSIFTGFAAIPFTTALLYGIESLAEEIGEDYLEDYALGMITDKMDNIMGSIPEAITVAQRRLDPFYETHYQVAGVFKYAKTNSAGMAFTADTGHQEIYPIVQDIKLKTAVRNEDGELTGLVYSVQKAHEVESPERFNRPNPQKPDEFMLTIDEIKERLRNKKLRRNLYLKATNVKLSAGQIKYIKFDSGIYLTPDETGDLQQAGVLSVIGYDRIYLRHKQQFYYRASADRYTSNNLSALPSFELDEGD